MIYFASSYYLFIFHYYFYFFFQASKDFFHFDVSLNNIFFFKERSALQASNDFFDFGEGDDDGESLEPEPNQAAKTIS